MCYWTDCADWIDLRKILYSFNDSLKLRVILNERNSRILFFFFFYPFNNLLTVSALLAWFLKLIAANHTKIKDINIDINIEIFDIWRIWKFINKFIIIGSKARFSLIIDWKGIKIHFSTYIIVGLSLIRFPNLKSFYWRDTEELNNLIFARPRQRFIKSWCFSRYIRRNFYSKTEKQTDINIKKTRHKWWRKITKCILNIRLERVISSRELGRNEIKSLTV